MVGVEVMMGSEPGGGARKLVRQHDLASALGVSDKRVATWRTRQDVNGFPNAAACWIGPSPGGRPGARLLWDLDEVLEWFSTYDERKQRARGAISQRGRTRPKREV